MAKPKRDSEPGTPPLTEDRVISTGFAHAPFAWQHGRQLLLLSNENGLWMLAELRFEPELCRYVELRRAGYQWEREAIGALVSRALAAGEDAAEKSAANVCEWLSAHHDPVQFATTTRTTQH